MFPANISLFLLNLFRDYIREIPSPEVVLRFELTSFEYTSNFTVKNKFDKKSIDGN